MSAPSPADALGFDVYIDTDMQANGRSASGVELVANGMLHRLTTDTLPLIGSPTGYEEFGEDTRRWCGGTVTRESAQARAPQIAAILQRDRRIETVDVTVELADKATGYTMIVMVVAHLVTGQTIARVIGISSVTVDFLAQGDQ